MIYNTRVAPSPTGLFHIGTARAALYSWLAARATGGKFILRIDDTDAERNDEASVKVILDSMEWLGLDYDEIHYQSERMELYEHARDELLYDKKAYVEDGAVKLRLPDDLGDTWEDHITGTVKISDHDRKMINGLVLFRSDETPTYHFASVCDDIEMQVNFIIRGMDHLNNAPKHVAIYKAFGAPAPKFAHVGLIEIMKDGKRAKMSKRDDASSLMKYKEAGYDPDAILDYLMRVGWSHSAADYQKRVPMVSREEALRTFLTEGRMRSAPSLFDPVFLAKLDRRYKAAAGVQHFGKDVVG